jgi:hypothetical protein
VDVLVNDGGDKVVEFKLQIDPILHIEMRKHQKIRRVRSAGLNQILAKPNGS